MKKVIIKCKIKDKDSFEEKMAEIEMEFSPIYWQHDRVYVPRGYKRGMNLPRLIMRTEMRAVDMPAEYSLILKRHIEDSGVDVVEKTTIKDYGEMVNIILQMGFKPMTEISRRRQELIMGEGVEMYVDDVDGKDGCYAKIETRLEEGESVEAVREDLKKTFSTLGESLFVETAYFEMN